VGTTTAATEASVHVGCRLLIVYGQGPGIDPQGGIYLLHHGIIPERSNYYVHQERWRGRVGGCLCEGILSPWVPKGERQATYQSGSESSLEDHFIHCHTYSREQCSTSGHKGPMQHALIAMDGVVYNWCMGLLVNMKDQLTK
jgi:hypothetical protein